jgi:hypothetical protein
MNAAHKSPRKSINGARPNIENDIVSAWASLHTALTAAKLPEAVDSAFLSEGNAGPRAGREILGVV